MRLITGVATLKYRRNSQKSFVESSSSLTTTQLRQEGGRMKRSMLPALSAFFIAVLLSACTSAPVPSPTTGSSAPTGKPQVMKAELTAPPNVPPAITRREPAIVQVEMETVEK